jgi:hypothetical protein
MRDPSGITVSVVLLMGKDRFLDVMLKGMTHHLVTISLNQSLPHGCPTGHDFSKIHKTHVNDLDVVRRKKKKRLCCKLKNYRAR